MSFAQRKRRWSKYDADIDRTVDLFKYVVVDGGVLKAPDDFAKFRQVEKRELTESIFFEAAAKFEEFAFDTFEHCVRKKFKVSAAKADYIMGHPDGGTYSVHGWAIMDKLRCRGLNLLGAHSFFARINSRIDARTRKVLEVAHQLRNRIGHEGKSNQELLKLMRQLGVPPNQMRGMSAGRFLLEHNPSYNNWTSRFPMFLEILTAYMKYARQWCRYG